MFQSEACNLHGLTPTELIAKGEEAEVMIYYVSVVLCTKVSS